MKKALCIFFVVLMAVTIIGCRRQTATGPATLRVGIWDQNQAGGLERVLAEFTAESGIQTRVEVTPWGDYWTILEAAATGGALPDIFWMHSNEVQRYMDSGLLMDLTQRIAGSSVADMGNFPPEIVQLYNLRGKQYGIPKDVDTIALFYNKRHFEAAGIPLPTNNWTWNDLREAARALTIPASNQFGIVFSPEESQTGYWNFIYQNGGYVISDDKRTSGFDNPRTIEAMEYIVGLVRDGYSPGVTITAENDAMTLMQGGVVSMATFGSWMLSAFKQSPFFVQNCDVVMLPSSNSGNRATIYNGLGWSAANNTTRPEEAWKLLEFLSSERAQRRLSEEGIAISAFRGTAVPFSRGFPEFNVAAFTDQLAYVVMRPYSVNTNAWEYMAVQLWNEVWTGRRPVADVSREIARNMNDLLAREQR